MSWRACPTLSKTTLHRTGWKPHRAARWPQLARLDVRYRGDYAYIDAVTTDDEIWPLCRLPLHRAPPADGASRSTWPAETATKTPFLPSGLPRRHP